MKIILKILRVLFLSSFLSLVMIYFYYYQINKINLSDYGKTLTEASNEVNKVASNYSKYKQIQDMEKTYFSLYNFMQGATMEEVKNSHVLNRTIYPLSYFDENQDENNICKILFIFGPNEKIVCQISHKNNYVGDIYFSKLKGNWTCEDVYLHNKNTFSCRDLAIK